MDWETFCLGKAQECDLRGDETVDEELKSRWYDMARDWRTAASDPEPPNARGGPE